MRANVGAWRERVRLTLATWLTVAHIREFADKAELLTVGGFVLLGYAALDEAWRPLFFDGPSLNLFGVVVFAAAMLLCGVAVLLEAIAWVIAKRAVRRRVR